MYYSAQFGCGPIKSFFSNKSGKVHLVVCFDVPFSFLFSALVHSMLNKHLCSLHSLSLSLCLFHPSLLFVYGSDILFSWNGKWSVSVSGFGKNRFGQCSFGFVCVKNISHPVNSYCLWTNLSFQDYCFAFQCILSVDT